MVSEKPGGGRVPRGRSAEHDPSRSGLASVRARSRMTYAEHAERSRYRARLAGCTDSIHYAPDWAARADRLYAIANESGTAWWSGEGGPFLISDGRMVLIGDGVWFFETKGATPCT
jgi:hypothetical protein